MPSVDVHESCDSHKAPLLAARLVSQVLDEAFVIARAADESGQPWRYVSMLRNLRSGKLSDTDEITFIASKGDSTLTQNNADDDDDDVVNVVATSTPQKIGDATKAKSENILIGQGDEEYNMQNELSKSTSTFINHLFDMSEVERVVICDDTQVVHEPSADNLLTQAMLNIMETYVNSTFNLVVDDERHSQINSDTQIIDKIVEITEDTEKSESNIIVDALQSDIARDVAFYIEEDDADAENNNSIEVIEDEFADITGEQVQEIIEIVEVDDAATPVEEAKTDMNQDNFYENAYLTLNRDYEQYSEDEVEPVLEDPKGLTMQEVELVTANTSEDELSEIEQDQDERKELAAVSGVSGVSGKSKSSLISRCRSQTAKLLSCLRGFWRRKTPGKRKEERSHRPNRGLCPLSPDARRRAASVLEQIDLYSPTPSRSAAWKFNTVNETLVSSQWKGYEFENQPIDRGEHGFPNRQP